MSLLLKYNTFYLLAEITLKLGLQSTEEYFSYIAYAFFVFTPHAQRERGKVIGRGVLYLWSKKNFESYFRDRLTFSNVDSRTSR